MACVAIGLWMHDRFLLSTANRTAEEKAVAELSTAAAPLAAAGRQPPHESALAELSRQVESTPLPSGTGLLLAGSDWRVQSARAPSGETPPAAGDRIDWSVNPMNPNPFADPIEGRFNTPSGPQLAVAYRLPGEAGRVVAYRAADSILIHPGDFWAAAPLVSLMTFLWLSGLLSMCTFMAGKRLHDMLTGELVCSEDRALRREQALLRTRDAVIFGLAKLAESRDSDTGEHVERISLYCQRLSAALRRHAEYRELITPAFVRLIEASSVLHDIGKVGIADAILHKPGPLTSVERTEIKKHAEIGGDCLAEIERRLGASNFLQMAREIALCHHERWDGDGYPRGLKAEEIPLAARIVAIADNYDALISRRPYKEAFPHDKVVAMIRNGVGTQFDPRLVDVFLEIEQEFREIAELYAAAGRQALRIADESVEHAPAACLSAGA
ncbi:MAG TPA: HD domain-containing phosphohydrolase [Pirellulales bacterium]|nr:HD domain-containing phosphohydrolase [Pirellulales bacterium]